MDRRAILSPHKGIHRMHTHETGTPARRTGVEALRLPGPTYLGIGAADLALTQQVSAATGESRVHHATVSLDYLPGDSASTCRDTMLEGYTQHSFFLSHMYLAPHSHP